ncbi:MAG: FxsA family protein [Candidatus Nanohaloarchaea archaeon]
MRLRYILILLLVLPFMDLWLLMEVASAIGFWKTLAVVLLTGLIGAEIVRREGRFVLRKLRSSVTAEEMSRNFIEATMLVLSGLLLLSPGLVTDLMGVLLAFRPLRERIVAQLAKRFKESSSFRFEIGTF